MLTLKEAVVMALGSRSMTYREITDTINRDRSYIPRDGLFVPPALIRTTIKENRGMFAIDKTTTPHRVRARVPSEVNTDPEM